MRAPSRHRANLSFSADIDSELAEAERTRITSLIASELSPDHATALHPLIPALCEPSFSPLIEAELARKAANEPLNGIDLSRYEALDPPSTSPTSDEDRPEVLEAWRDILRKAYASSTHLQTRSTNLSLLEKFGKNAWLIGNSQLEDILRTLEKEVAQVKEHIDYTNLARKNEQESVSGEIATLEQSWQRGIGNIIEVEVASESLRKDILERRRQGAQ
jgi:pre-mRNA-splicing factor SPF27